MSELSPARQRRAGVVLILAATVIALGLAELALRVTDRGPWSRFEALERAPRMTVPDDALGWALEPGVYRWAPDAAADEITLTIGEDGARGAVSEGSASILLFGGSFVQGFGLSDGEDLGAVLGRERPADRVRNYGVPGFGTLQARRLYERVSGTGAGPETVIYGLNELHDARNACTRSWLHALDRAGAHHPWVQCPWAAWNGRAVIEYPPRRYRHWRASEVSALVHLVELASIDLRDRFLRTKSETTVRLIAGWRDRVEARGGRFSVALLWAPERHAVYTRRLQALGVEVHDLRDAGYPDAPGSTIPGDGHPSASVHQQWGRGLAAGLEAGT